MSAANARKLESIEIDLLLTGIAERYGYDFRHYAQASMTRRVRDAMRHEGVTTPSALLSLVLHQPEAMLRFVERIAVHTTSMFRDTDVYQALRSEVVPLLKTYPFVRIWHAGCSTGEEVYSLAIVLHEEGLYDRCRIYATDISDRVLERAKAGIFPLHLMRDYTAAYHRAGGREDFSSYYKADRAYALFRKALGRNVIFAQHNLACDHAFNEFQLIMCRNVLIYFDQSLRERAHELFHGSLSKFGVLVLGRKESLRFSHIEPHYRELEAGSKIYRRLR